MRHGQRSSRKKRSRYCRTRARLNWYPNTLSNYRHRWRCEWGGWTKVRNRIRWHTTHWHVPSSAALGGMRCSTDRSATATPSARRACSRNSGSIIPPKKIWQQGTMIGNMVSRTSDRLGLMCEKRLPREMH